MLTSNTSSAIRATCVTRVSINVSRPSPLGRTAFCSACLPVDRLEVRFQRLTAVRRLLLRTSPLTLAQPVSNPFWRQVPTILYTHRRRRPSCTRVRTCLADLLPLPHPTCDDAYRRLAGRLRTLRPARIKIGLPARPKSRRLVVRRQVAAGRLNPGAAGESYLACTVPAARYLSVFSLSDARIASTRTTGCRRRLLLWL